MKYYCSIILVLINYLLCISQNTELKDVSKKYHYNLCFSAGAIVGRDNLNEKGNRPYYLSLGLLDNKNKLLIISQYQGSIPGLWIDWTPNIWPNEEWREVSIIFSYHTSNKRFFFNIGGGASYINYITRGNYLYSTYSISNNNGGPFSSSSFPTGEHYEKIVIKEWGFTFHNEIGMSVCSWFSIKNSLSTTFTIPKIIFLDVLCIEFKLKV